jgi:CHASE3 domain sensor protein
MTNLETELMRALQETNRVIAAVRDGGQLVDPSQEDMLRAQHGRNLRVLEAARGRRYLLDGDTYTLQSMRDSNPDSPELIEALRALKIGESLEQGGGAQPLVLIQRVG